MHWGNNESVRQLTNFSLMNIPKTVDPCSQTLDLCITGKQHSTYLEQIWIQCICVGSPTLHTMVLRSLYVIREKLLKSLHKVFKQTSRQSRSAALQKNVAFHELASQTFGRSQNSSLPSSLTCPGPSRWQHSHRVCQPLLPTLYCLPYCEVQSWVSLDHKQEKWTS